MTARGILGIELTSSTILAAYVERGGSSKVKGTQYQPSDIVLRDAIGESLYFAAPVDANEFTSRMHAALRKVIGTVLDRGYQPAEIRLVFGSPWHISSISTLQHATEGSTKLDKRSIDKKLTEHCALFEKDEEKRLGFELRCIEHAAVATRINGYAVRTIVETEAQEASVDVLSTFMSESDITVIEGIVKHAFPNATIQIHSSAWVYGASIDRIEQSIDDSVVIEASGEVTDITIIRSDAVSTVATIPLGAHSMLRALAEKANLAYPLNLSALALMHDGALAPEKAIKLQAALAWAYAEWAGAVGRALIGPNGEKPVLPGHVFLATGTEYRRTFEELLGSSDVVGKLFSGTKPVIHNLDSFPTIFAAFMHTA